MSKPAGLEKRDPNLPYIHLLWSDSELVEFFNRQVFPEVWPGHQIASVAQESMTWSPGKRGTAVYQLDADDSDKTEPMRTVVSFDRDDKMLGDAYADRYGLVTEMPAEGPFPALLLPDHRCLIEFFPHDCKLPALARAANIDEMLPHLAAIVGHDGSLQDLECKVSSLRYRPHHRCVLLYSLENQATGEKHEIIGKLYRKSHKATKAFTSNRALFQAAKGTRLIVPEPFMFLEDLNLVLMECVRGPTMKDRFRTTTDIKALVRSAAEGAAVLHGLPYEGGEIRTVQTELAKVRGNADPLHLVTPDLAAQLDDLLNRITSLADRLGLPKPSAIHGALRPAHLVVVGDQVALIDLDGLGGGDPAFDLAEFMSKCITQGQIQEAESRSALSEYFLSRYQSHVGIDKELADRVRIICSLTFVTRAVRSYLRAPHRYLNERESSRPVKYLREAAACLDHLKN